MSKKEEKIALSEKHVEELTIVKLKLPRLIPISLIEDVKGRTFTPEQFYSYQEKQIDNPNNYLFALIDAEKKIQGYLWCEINMLDDSLFVNTFSISKEYWGKGTAIPFIIKFLEGLKAKVKASRVFWVTTNEKFFTKKKFKKSRNVLMEYNAD